MCCSRGQFLNPQSHKMLEEVFLNSVPWSHRSESCSTFLIQQIRKTSRWFTHSNTYSKICQRRKADYFCQISSDSRTVRSIICCCCWVASFNPWHFICYLWYCAWLRRDAWRAIAYMHPKFQIMSEKPNRLNRGLETGNKAFLTRSFLCLKVD